MPMWKLDVVTGTADDALPDGSSRHFGHLVPYTVRIFTKTCKNAARERCIYDQTASARRRIWRFYRCLPTTAIGELSCKKGDRLEPQGKPWGQHGKIPANW